VKKSKIYCEDLSPTIKKIRESKKHGKKLEISGDLYEYIGDDMLFCLKSNTIKKL
jgi:hypothetical protein